MYYPFEQLFCSTISYYLFVLLFCTKIVYNYFVPKLCTTILYSILYYYLVLIFGTPIFTAIVYYYIILFLYCLQLFFTTFVLIFCTNILYSILIYYFVHFKLFNHATIIICIGLQAFYFNSTSEFASLQPASQPGRQVFCRQL